jgi:hypothetical protein
MWFGGLEGGSGTMERWRRSSRPCRATGWPCGEVVVLTSAEGPSPQLGRIFGSSRNDALLARMGRSKREGLSEMRAHLFCHYVFCMYYMY